MTILFISDLHLSADRPDIGSQFLDFLAGEARDSEALYILGDLFEAWVGDDDPDEHYAAMKFGLRKLVDAGVPTYFMHGNRDFMIGVDFAHETGVQILGDPYELEVYGTRVLLTHGDAMCIDDVEYQQVRRMTRNPEWQQMMLTKPLEERLAIAAHARTQSAAHNAGLTEEISDVNQREVEKVIANHKIDILLHGHTHRPDIHIVAIGGRPAKRIVLGDWYEQGSVLRWTESAYSLDIMPRLASQNENGIVSPAP